MVSPGIFKHFTGENGLISDKIYGILDDNQDNLWLSTPKGLIKYDRKKEIFINFDHNDGLQGDAFNMKCML